MLISILFSLLVIKVIPLIPLSLIKRFDPAPIVNSLQSIGLFVKNFSTKSFLNSFYSSKFVKNKDKQVSALNDYIKKFKSNDNLILVTHYVLISEVLDYGPSSGEIVVSDKNFNIIGKLEINF